MGGNNNTCFARSAVGGVYGLVSPGCHKEVAVTGNMPGKSFVITAEGNMSKANGAMCCAGSVLSDRNGLCTGMRLRHLLTGMTRGQKGSTAHQNTFH